MGGVYSENTMRKARSKGTKGTVYARHQSKTKALEQSGAIQRPKGAVGGCRKSSWV